MKYTEYKIVCIELSKNKYLNLQTLPDFIVTDKWLKDEVFKHKLKKCERWLKIKGFVKDENGFWNLNSKDSVYLTIPEYLYNPKNGGIYPKLGKIKGNVTIRFNNHMILDYTYDKYENYPRKINSEVKMLFSLKDYGSDEYYFYLKQIHLEEGFKGEHQTEFLKYLIENKTSNINLYKWSDKFFENNDNLKLLKTAKTLNKFNL